MVAECTEEEKTRTVTDEDGTVRIYLLNLNLDLIFTAKECKGVGFSSFFTLKWARPARQVS